MLLLGADTPNTLRSFFDQIDRFIPASYTPTEQDVLRVRIRTTGVDVCTEYYNLALA